MSELAQAALEMLGAIGAAGTVLFGLSNWLGERWAARIAAREEAKYAAALAEQQAKYAAALASDQSRLNETLHRVNAKYDQQLEIAKAAISRYSESQFAMYGALWQSLCDLRVAGDDLWESALPEKVKRFAKQVKETRVSVHKAALILTEEHYQGLLSLLEAFDQFNLGKTTLVELRSHPDRANDNKDFVRDLIEQNGQVRDTYTAKLAEIRLHLKEQIGGVG